MNKALEGVGINKECIYMTNIVKCRTPSNRAPQNDEVAECLNYLRNQVILVKPKIIVLLGKIAATNILGKEIVFEAIRGNWVERKNIMYMPTWNPSELLKDESKKIQFWKDLKLVKEKIETK